MLAANENATLAEFKAGKPGNAESGPVLLDRATFYLLDGQAGGHFHVMRFGTHRLSAHMTPVRGWYPIVASPHPLCPENHFPADAPRARPPLRSKKVSHLRVVA